MDFHSHLDKHEVIGLLAGSWDAAARVLRVERAFPVREALPAAGGSSSVANDYINVEMDPEDQYKVRCCLVKKGRRRCVGCGSHPRSRARKG